MSPKVAVPAPPERAKSFGVIRMFPVLEFDERGELITPPRQYTTIADQPEPLRLAA